MSTTPDLGIIVAGAIGSFGSTAGLRPLRMIGSIVANITLEEKHIDELEITDHPVEQGATITDHAFKRPVELTLRVAWSNSPGQPATLLGGLSGALTNQLTGAVQQQITGAAFKQIGGSALGNLAVAQLAKVVANPLISFGAQVNNQTGKGTSTVNDVYQSLLDLQNSRVPFTIFTGKRRYSNMLIKSITTETTKKTENSLECLLRCREVILVSTTVISSVPPSDQTAPQDNQPVADTGTQQAAPIVADPGSVLANTLRQIYVDGLVFSFPVN